MQNWLFLIFFKKMDGVGFGLIPMVGVSERRCREQIANHINFRRSLSIFSMPFRKKRDLKVAGMFLLGKIMSFFSLNAKGKIKIVSEKPNSFGSKLV